MSDILMYGMMSTREIILRVGRAFHIGGVNSRERPVGTSTRHRE
jgi:hypothetical protein